MKNELVGWDDGKLYFYDENSKGYCVNDYKELFDKITDLCIEYFRKNSVDSKNN